MHNSEIVQHTEAAIPNIMYRAYSLLINTGYQPLKWRQATGAVLKKKGKTDYQIPKSYRVTSLLNCFGKVSERIIANRLGALAETTHLIHQTQIGGRRSKSAIDAALVLTDFFQQHKKLGLITSTLFLDTKGAYDYESKNKLLTILSELGLPLSLISWIKSFLSTRTVRLTFDGQTEEFVPVSTGIPQGSPVSPILFLIYIRNLFTSNTVHFTSYVDDIAIYTASTSVHKNTRILQREAKNLFQNSQSMAIQFDKDKIDFIHFSNPTKTIYPNFKLAPDNIVEHSKTVKWLGILFNNTLSFKQHILERIKKAKGAFFRLQRLTNTERGLSAFAVRQLYLACINSVATYGAELYWRQQVWVEKSFQSLQNLGLRKILGAFRTSPIKPMEVEAALPPPQVMLNSMIRRYAFRIHKMSPEHPIHQRIITYRLKPPPTTKQIPTQLQRIADSIKSCIPDSLEQIHHHTFKPWDLHIPYSTHISKLSKTEEAEAHDEAIQDLAHTDTLLIYSDASSMPKCSGIGVGLAAYSCSQATPYKIHQQQSNIGSENLVYNGELEGITLAMEYAAEKEQPPKDMKVFADNQAAIHRLARPSDNPGQAWQLRCIKAANKVSQKGSHISLQWTPGHENTFGNEEADFLAKEAANQPPTSNTTSFAMMGLRIKAMDNKDWKRIIHKYKKTITTANFRTYTRRFPWQLRKRLIIPQDTPKVISSAFYQLKLGHGYFNSYLFPRTLHWTDLCICGDLQTPNHLLLHCPRYRTQRSIMKDTLKTNKLTENLLFHTKGGIEATLEYIRDTRISTRKWKLETEVELDEDEEEGDEEEGED